MYVVWKLAVFWSGIFCHLPVIAVFNFTYRNKKVIILPSLVFQPLYHITNKWIRNLDQRESGEEIETTSPKQCKFTGTCGSDFRFPSSTCKELRRCLMKSWADWNINSFCWLHMTVEDRGQTAAPKTGETDAGYQELWFTGADNPCRRRCRGSKTYITNARDYVHNSLRVHKSRGTWSQGSPQFCEIYLTGLNQLLTNTKKNISLYFQYEERKGTIFKYARALCS